MTRTTEILVESEIDADIDRVWRVLGDTNRLNEIMGDWMPYQVTETVGPDNVVIRQAHGKLGPFNMKWREGFGEWIEPRYMSQLREFENGTLQTLGMEARLSEQNSKTRVRYKFTVSWQSWFGGLLNLLGIYNRIAKKLVRTVESNVPEAVHAPVQNDSVKQSHLTPATRQRLHTLLETIEKGAYGHGLTERLGNYLDTALAVDLKKMRPLAIARNWNVSRHDLVELFVEAQRQGILSMRWEVQCPRCRGTDQPAQKLYELPRGIHCESCNIDYERDFSNNVELVFSPAAWLRPLPDGDFCLMGPASTPHVKVQRRLEPNETRVEPLELPPGRYRLRTVEAGAQVDIEYDGSDFPDVIVSDDDVESREPQQPGQITFHNLGDTPRSIVIEDRSDDADSLNGSVVISMQAFRELCPEQLLRPGDEVAIDHVTIIFTDLKGSTSLYKRVGDTTAYGLVRDHFEFLAEKIRRHHGALIKTMGDAVMAVFSDPRNAMDAAVEIQQEVTALKSGSAEDDLTLKLGMHRGPCIAITTSGFLDYFGTTVNLAARLQEESRGQDIIISKEIAEDLSETHAQLIAGLEAEQTVPRGIDLPQTYFRIYPSERSAQVPAGPRD